jgi:hypothetical protein
MKSTGRIFLARGLALVASAVVVGLLAGCGNIFTPKHKVTVDAICAAGVAKPAGQSFRLVGKRSVLAQGQVNIGVVSACVSAALAHAGMYEAPEKVPADLLIEVSCGQDNAPRMDPATRETYLELSARTNNARAMETSREPEIWNVRVSIQGLVGRIESSMPLLAAVASSYSATDTKFQSLIEVPQNNASIAAVREAALKTLDAKAAGAAAAPAAATATTTPTPAATGAK